MIKLVREYINEKFSEESDSIHDMGIGKPALIHKWMKKHGVEKYTINTDQTVNINTDLMFFKKHFHELPEFIQINYLKGDLNFYESGLKHLGGFPKSIDGNIYLGRNKLTSAKGLPQDGDILNLMLFENTLTSLKGCPKSIRGNFNCSKNPLYTLDGMPVDIQGQFICYGMTNMTDEFVHKYIRDNKIHIGGLKIIGWDAASHEEYA